MIENGAQVDLLNKNRYSALYIASQMGHTEIAKILLENGAQVDLQNVHGLSALMVASQSGHAEVVKLLLDNGAQIHLKKEVHSVDGAQTGMQNKG